MAIITAEPMLPGGPRPRPSRSAWSRSTRRETTTMISVSIGKTEDVRTDASFVDLVIADPDIADISPLTDKSLSILGRKSGTTRISAYADGKKLVGVFDVEVTYDTSLLQATLNRRFPHAKIKATSVNGRIMLTGAVQDAPTVDKAVTLARQFGPDVINSMTVMSPQQVMLEVRFIEANRQAGRELGVQWNGISRTAASSAMSATAPTICRSCRPARPQVRMPGSSPGRSTAARMCSRATFRSRRSSRRACCPVRLRSAS